MLLPLVLNDYCLTIINVYLSYLTHSLIISLSSLLALLHQVDHKVSVLIIHTYVLVWIARVDTARRITPLHRLSLSTWCGNVFALSQPAPSSTPLETTYNHPTHTTTTIIVNIISGRARLWLRASQEGKGQFPTVLSPSVIISEIWPSWLAILISTAGPSVKILSEQGSPP